MVLVHVSVPLRTLARTVPYSIANIIAASTGIVLLSFHNPDACVKMATLENTVSILNV